jgi:hypothetical protein
MREDTIPCAFGATQGAGAEKHAASGEHPGFVRCLSGLAFDIGSMVVRSGSAVGFAAVANGGDRDGVLVSLIEEPVIVAAAETEAGERRDRLVSTTTIVLASHAARSH